MLLDDKFNAGGGQPDRKSIPTRHSKGWPETRDPAAERATRSHMDSLGEGAARKLQQRTAPSFRPQ